MGAGTGAGPCSPTTDGVGGGTADGSVGQAGAAAGAGDAAGLAVRTAWGVAAIAPITRARRSGGGATGSIDSARNGVTPASSANDG